MLLLVYALYQVLYNYMAVDWTLFYVYLIDQAQIH